MNPISGDVALKFCELCNWAQECWLTHRRLFDENDRTERTIRKAKYFTERLAIITQEYTLLQICKLHDPATQKNSLNITIDYMVRFGDWGPHAEEMHRIVSRLDALFENLKSARNKVLAHNDLEALMNSATLGAFPKGLDDQYFSALQELVNVVHTKWFDGPYPFNDLAGADVDEFLYILEKS
ncbi:MAG: hypothetical protein HY848_22855 [Betaproteobacteria bacterium]|nr:hypothetical protein [Betaproteobacteria bacterium]